EFCVQVVSIVKDKLHFLTIANSIKETQQGCCCSNMNGHLTIFDATLFQETIPENEPHLKNPYKIMVIYALQRKCIPGYRCFTKFKYIGIDSKIWVCQTLLAFLPPYL